MSTEVDTGPSALRTWFPLVTLWIVWGTTYLGTSAMVQTIPPLLGAGSRYFVGGVVLALMIVLGKGPRALRVTRSQLLATAIAGLGIIGIWGAIVPLALEHIPGGIAALIAASVPLWIVLLRVFAGDRIGWRTTLGVVVGIAGVGAMLLRGASPPCRARQPSRSSSGRRRWSWPASRGRSSRFGHGHSTFPSMC